LIALLLELWKKGRHRSWPFYYRDLTDEETAALARLLRDAIDADHYPLSPRVQMLKGIFAKIRPEAKPEPLPPQKHYDRRGRADIGDDEFL